MEPPMTTGNSNGDKDSSVESTDSEQKEVPPLLLVESIRDKTDLINAQSQELAEKLGPEYGQPAKATPDRLITELLAAANNLTEAAYAIQSER